MNFTELLKLRIVFLLKIILKNPDELFNARLNLNPRRAALCDTAAVSAGRNLPDVCPGGIIEPVCTRIGDMLELGTASYRFVRSTGVYINAVAGHEWAFNLAGRDMVTAR